MSMTFNLGSAGRGSGGSSLAFTVVGGTTAPANPAENMVWVNTASTISDWAITNETVVSPQEGYVVFRTGLTSSAPMPVLDDTSIIVYPVSAQQYISGSWVNVPAMTYKNNAWVAWRVYLFNAGDTCVATTGGWMTQGLAPSDYPDRAAALTVTTIADGVRLTQSNGGMGGIYRTINKVDLTTFSSLCFTGSSYMSGNPMHIYITPNIGSAIGANAVANYSFPSGTMTYTDQQVIDLTGITGEQYIYFSIRSTDGKYIDLNELYLTA